MKITAKKIAKLYDLPIDFAKSSAPFLVKELRTSVHIALLMNLGRTLQWYTTLISLEAFLIN